MRNRLLSLSLILFAAFLIIGCQKDTLFDDHIIGNPKMEVRTDNIITSGGGNNCEETYDDPTILGPQRLNPYTVENFTIAYNFLHDPDITSLPITHYYLKFTPETWEQASELANSGLDLFEFPLDREIIHMGDFYLESGYSPDDILPLYTVVKVTDSIPDVPHTNLSNLYLGSSDEALVRRALYQKGYNPDDIGFGLDAPIDEGGGGGGGGTLTTGSCDCLVYSDIRRPGGCIQVWDTENEQFEEVRRVKVVFKDNFFDIHSTYTDDNGCFKINHRYFGKANMWVHFASESRVQVRGARSGVTIVYEWLLTLRHHAESLSGPIYNNIQVRYLMWENHGSGAHMYWGACTVGNALHEFYDYSNVEGINSPPSHLDILIGQRSSIGYALLSGQGAVTTAIELGLIGAGYFTFPILPIIGAIAIGAIDLILPDIFVGIDFRNSDQLKQIAYHEIAHSSHYTQVGPGFWENLVWAEIWANGHGNSSSTNASLIALCESWAEHIGIDFAGQSYPVNNSDPIWASWITRSERVKNESLNHIPIGLYHDLIDDNVDVSNSCDYNGNCGPINDHASGFSNQQLFDFLTADIESPAAFINEILIGLPSVQQSQINNLFSSY